jgi:4-amino-4-deoxy-L-arabinose transferase-like glycosyltransferase
VTLSATPLTVRVAQVRSLGVAVPLGALVAVSFAVRVALGFLRPTPYYFPDEYRYAAISRSLVDHGHLLVRGAPANFLPVLQPILTAPAWLLGSVGESYRAVQTINAVAVSLAAIPVFLIAKQLGLSRRAGLICAALALMVPSLLYSSFILAEPIAYPLVLGAVAAAVRALDSPSRGRIALFVVLVLLAAFARLQFIVLLPCFLVSLAALLVREQRFRATARQHWRGALLLLLVVGGVAAAGPLRNTGYYPSVFQLGLHPRTLVASLGRNAIVLVFASGFVLVPGALLGLFYAIRRPVSRPELASALMAGTLLLALVFQASAYGQTVYAQERYTFNILPLIPLLFALYARRGWPARTYQALLAFALVAAALITPLTTMALDNGEMHSSVLFAIVRLRAMTGDGAGSASIIVVATAAALAAVIAALSAWPRVRTQLALTVAAVFLVAVSVGAYSFDQLTSQKINDSYAGAHPSWVDDSGVTGARLVLLPGALKTEALEQLFWNRSVDRVVLLPGATRIDSFAMDTTRVAEDGTVLVAGHPLTTPVLIDEFAATAQLQNAQPVAVGLTGVLYRANGPVRLRMLAIGSLRSGWLAQHGVFAVWPNHGETRVAGYVRLKLSVGKRPLRINFVGLSKSLTIAVPPHTTRTVNIPVCSSGPTAFSFKGTETGALDDHRRTSARSTPALFVADPNACPAT